MSTAPRTSKHFHSRILPNNTLENHQKTAAAFEPELLARLASAGRKYNLRIQL